MRGTVEIGWQAEDPNEDNLEFEVFFKGIGEATWKSIEDELREPGITWRTVRVPDGTYRLKVTASDAPSNPPARALATEEISEPFIIDNTPPSVSDIETKIAGDGSVTVTARLTDAASSIHDALYSIHSGDWVILAPADGIFDSKEETIEFSTEALVPGEHTIVINTRDSAGNIGAGKQTVTVPKR